MMIADTIPLDHTEVLIEDDDSRHIPLDHTEVLIEDDDSQHNPTGPHRSSYRR